MNEEERNKAYQFLQELDKNGYRYTADGRELYIIENVFHKIDKLQKELDKKDKIINNAKDTIEYYLLGNMSLDDFNKREKELDKLKQTLEDENE